MWLAVFSLLLLKVQLVEAKPSDELHEGGANISEEDIHRPRRAQSITSQLPTSVSLQIGAQLPSGAPSPFQAKPLLCSNPQCTGIAGVYAGNAQAVYPVILGLTNGETFGASMVFFKFVRQGVTSDLAQRRSQCVVDGLLSGVVNGTGWSTGACPATAILGASTSSYNVQFLMGGQYKLCYSNNANFLTADVFAPKQGTVITVNGIYNYNARCNEDTTCVTNRPYYCFFLKNAYNNMYNNYAASTSCVIDFSEEATAGFIGNPGKATWSAQWGQSYDPTTGIISPAQIARRQCGSAVEGPDTSSICNVGGPNCFSPAGSQFVSMTVKSPGPDGKGQFALPPASNVLSGSSSFVPKTFAACYCPDFSATGSTTSCTSFNTEYGQQVGILHFFIAKTCGNGVDADLCGIKLPDTPDSPDFTGTTSVYRFAINVGCPTDACSSTGFSQLKIVAQKPENDLPYWSNNYNHSCKTAIHGVNAKGLNVLPASQNLPMALTTGGTRQDRKVWNYWGTASGDLNYSATTAGFLFQMGTTDYEFRGGNSAETFDICYCDNNCTQDSAIWFKVGQIGYQPFLLVSGARNNSKVQAHLALEFVNQPGIVGFYRPPASYNYQGLTEGGQLKLLSDPGLNFTDADCQKDYDPTVSTTLTAATAGTMYAGRANTTADAFKLIFNSGNLNNVITVTKAGFTAVCYCAASKIKGAPPGQCTLGSWVLTTRITIRGPRPNQYWAFSSNVIFRFQIDGWGLSKNDKLRLIPPTGSCLANGDLKGPDGSYPLTNMMIGCPSPCSQVGGTNDVINGDISVAQAADDAINCDNQNTNCQSSDIKAVTVLDSMTTRLQFTSGIAGTLSNGDLITLGDNIACDPTDPNCNVDKLQVLKGNYTYGDNEGPRDLRAPTQYVSGWAVTLVPGAQDMVTIPIGWASAPRFIVNYVNGKRGKWSRHNKVITKEELMAAKETKLLKVCWQYSTSNPDGPDPQYVAEVGTMSLIAPNAMSNSRVSLTTTVKGQTAPNAPFIVSFTTAAAQIGQRYTQVKGPTQLRIYMTSTNFLIATFQDGSAIRSNPGESDISLARQYICGKLFAETWSSNEAFGFPTPIGCYYKVYGPTQELNILFDSRNGLSPGTSYQLVMKGVASPQATFGSNYVSILTTDDVNINPYIAIEMGMAPFGATLQDPQYGTSGVKWYRPDGAKIVASGNADNVVLYGGQVLQLQLKGDVTGGGIVASSYLRIYLWPLTQWNVDPVCTVTCTPYDPVTSPCGFVQDCKGDSVVPNFQRNILRLILPIAMTTVTQTVTHMLVFPSLTLPPSAWFPTRLAAQLTKTDDTKPDYIETVGTFVMKQPDAGQGIGRLLDVFGSGNSYPFRGDTMNVLYVNLVNSATLYAAVQTGDAAMVLTLPAGYTCVRTQDISGQSPWRTEDLLPALLSKIPRGSGTPDEGTGTRGWSVYNNSCVFTLRQNAVLYAGSSLLIRVTVNNPVKALTKEDPSNKWQVTLTSKGYGSGYISMPPILFGTSAANFTGNVAVLGILTETRIVPTVFQAGGQGLIRIFFRTEQATGVGGGLIIRAPDGFVFSPCVPPNQPGATVGDLPDAYYGTTKLINVRRLPGVISCQTSSVPYNNAKLAFSGGLLAGTRYGFYISATNPASFSAAMMSGWRITTLSGYSTEVDGTRLTVPVASISSTVATSLGFDGGASFGLYTYQLQNGIDVQVTLDQSKMMPYSRTMTKCPCNVVKMVVPVDMVTTLRITAPAGFTWNFTSNDFMYQLYGRTAKNPVSSFAIKADLPGGIPTAMENVLIWPQAFYKANTLYGFQAYVNVPDQTPTNSINEFIFEFGYDRTDLGQRFAATSVQAINSGVRALLNAKVDYTTNVEQKANNVVFLLQTITQIGELGGLVITGPPGFVISPTCTVGSAPDQRGAPYDVASNNVACQPLPSDVTCSSTASNLGVQITIATGPSGFINASCYRWTIPMINPAAGALNVASDTSPCGYGQCWSFRSLQDLIRGGPDLDISASAPSFNISIKLVQAAIPVLTPSQQANTKRDDRPLARDPIVIAFSLNRPVIFPTLLTVRAPLGTIFNEDCGADIEIRPSAVFGEPLPAVYASWVDGCNIIGCRGEGPNAVIGIDPGATVGLQPQILFPLRISVAVNPGTQPLVSTWILDINGEASDPIPGYQLWTFVRTSTNVVSSARTFPGTKPTPNPVTFTFRPQNTVQGANMVIQVTAPTGFTFDNLLLVCKVMVQPVYSEPIGGPNDNPYQAPPPNYIGPNSLIWGDADVACAVDAATQSVLQVTVLSDSRALTGGQDYQLTVYVNNPISVVNFVQYWTLETFNSPQFSGVLPPFRDRVTIPGFFVNEKATRWVYLNQDAKGNSFTNGLQVVKGLYFEMTFPNKLTLGDTLLITGPAGMIFLQGSTPGSCLNFQWEPINGAALYLPLSPVTCNDTAMSWVIQELRDVQENTILKFRVDVSNPAKTPHVMQNYWNCVHLSGNDGRIYSSDSIQSWNVVPQLSNMRIALIGTLLQAGMASTISFSFMPVSDADEIYIAAKQPAGFNFEGCLATSLGHQVISTNQETVRVRAAVYAGVEVNLVLTKVMLASLGGQTVFDTITKLNTGAPMDQLIDFQGFRLPGKVTIEQQLIQSKYNADPVTYPVASNWTVRMGEPAIVSFRLMLTVTAVPGMMLRIRAAPYSLQSEGFAITSLTTGNPVAAQVLSVGAGELVARLGEPMLVGLDFQVMIMVTTPMMANAADSLWGFEILDSQALPVDTNDRLTTGFQLGDQILLQVSTIRAPPKTIVQLQVSIDPRSARPAYLRLVAPLGFNFTDNCLVSGGNNNEISACAHDADVSGRAAVILTVASGALSAPLRGLAVNIISPAQSAAEPTWYIDLRDSSLRTQLGWGEDTTGISISPMVGAGVVFPGIPSILGQLAITFVTQQKLNQGGVIRVGYPSGFVVSCSGSFFYPISISGDVVCSNFGKQGYFELTLSLPLAPGTQAFVVTVAPPNAIAINNFYVEVLYPNRQVMDAAMFIKGDGIQQGLPLKALSLVWGVAEASKTTQVSLGFSLTAPLPVKNPPLMAQIVIKPPQDITQQVVRPSNVEFLSSPLPVRNGTWMDTSDASRLVIFLDTKKVGTLQPGDFRLQLPVMLPVAMPKYNVWLMTICGPSPTTCTGKDDPNAFVTMPFAGFNLGEANPLAYVFFATADAHRHYALHVPLVISLLLALLVL